METFMAKTVILALLVATSRAASDFCDLTVGGFSYCPYGCCGKYTITCCSSGTYNRTTTYSYTSSLSKGVIAAFVVGSIIVLCVLIGIITCCVKACSNSGRRGTVIQQTQNQPSLIMMSTGQQYNYPVGQQPFPGQPQPFQVHSQPITGQPQPFIGQPYPYQGPTPSPGSVPAQGPPPYPGPASYPK